MAKRVQLVSASLVHLKKWTVNFVYRLNKMAT